MYDIAKHDRGPAAVIPIFYLDVAFQAKFAVDDFRAHDVTCSVFGMMPSGRQVWQIFPLIVFGEVAAFVQVEEELRHPDPTGQDTTGCTY